ncbi:MAG: FtsQ-type POTRA domain-containing protein [Clostridia bacterium]|nr:FtsQ-type POTRA domain-containing protein [Clostridia bacterium]
MQATQTFSVKAQQDRRRKRSAGTNRGSTGGQYAGQNVRRNDSAKVGQNSRAAGENTGGAQKKQVLYIYDRVTTKGSKEREMQYHFGEGYQRKYIPRDPRPKQAPPRQSARPDNNTYTRRSAPKTAAFTETKEFYSGGAAVKKRKKLILDNIINLFETIDERWVRELDMAKKQATLHKKFVEHRRGLFLAIVTLAILTIFILGVYKLFFVVRSIETEGSQSYSTEEIAAASGIEIGDNLYSFRTGSAEDSITLFCPYLKSVEVTRQIPTKVLISVEDDEARYYADIFGETLAMSSGLKVLGEISAEEAKAQGLTKLKLPVIDKAVAGRVVTFADAKDDRFVRELLAHVSESSLAARIGLIDLRDPYDIIMHCDNAYRLQFGSSADTELKLRMAEKTVNDPLFEQGTLARVDLSVTGEASVRYDLRLDLAADE